MIEILLQIGFGSLLIAGGLKLLKIYKIGWWLDDV